MKFFICVNACLVGSAFSNQFSLRGLSLEVEAKPFYHLETKVSNNCYETHYIDEHYKENGFVIGSCDESYNSFISKDLEKICDGHSEINLKNCPTDVVEIEILKLGKKAQDNDALEVEANHHHPFYHLETKLSNNCYETRYIDEHYKENGFVIGSCDDKFDTVVSKDDEKICDGHSEVNLKDCVTGIVEIEILKLGEATSI
jgi:hypothetical protein